MENTGLINGNRKVNSAPFAKGKCVFFTFAAVGVLLCVISSLVLNSIIFNMLNGGSNSHQIISYNTTEFPSVTVQHVASEGIKKGQPVGICTYDLGKVCPVSVQGTTDSILETLKPAPAGTQLISYVSDVSFVMSTLIQHAKQGNSQKIIFNGILSNFPLMYYTISTVDILQAIGEKPLDANESFKLMGSKIIYYSGDDHESTSKSIVTFIRTRAQIDGTYLHQFKTVLISTQQNKDHFEQSVTVDNSTVGFNIVSNLNVDDEFNAKYFSIGMTDSNTPTITLYFNSVSKGCQASVMSYQNNKLNSLNALQQGPKNVGCKTGLKTLTYDSNTVLILTGSSLAAITVDSQSGVLTTKTVKFSYTPYRNLEFQRNLEILFIGNDAKTKNQARNSVLFILFTNTANGFTQVMPITFDGNSFETSRLMQFTKSMKNMQATYLDTSNIKLFYQSGDDYKTMKVTFAIEKEESGGDIYEYKTPAEGIEIPLRSISPIDWLVIPPSISSSEILIISLLVNPTSLDFQLGKMPAVTTVNFIGLALQDAKSGEQLHVMSEGLTPIGTFNAGQLVSGMEYYINENGVSLDPRTNVRAGKAISSSQLIIYGRP